MTDPINNPKHYGSVNGIEPIMLTRHLPFSAGNCLKYLCRWRGKNGIEDLRKAAWYANDCFAFPPHQPMSEEWHDKAMLYIDGVRDDMTGIMLYRFLSALDDARHWASLSAMILGYVEGLSCGQTR